MIREALPGDDWEAAYADYLRFYETHHALASPLPDAEALLTALKLRYPLGLMTGKGTHSAAITLRAFGWQDWFGSVVTGDDVVHPKPDPEGVLRTARELDVAPAHCVYIGDSPADIEAGRAAGMRTIAAAWHTVYGARLRAAHADFWADTPEILRKMLVPPA